MVFDYFIYVVAGLALIYAIVVYFIQNRMVDKKEIEAIQAESKQVSEELSKAQKNKNQAEIDAAMKKQMEFLPKMNKMMFGQLKVMAVILVVFFAFNASVTYLNPVVKDDIVIPMKDDGLGCDKVANDGVFSVCYKVENSNYTRWNLGASINKDNRELGHNTTEFFIGQEGTPDSLIENQYGEKPPGVSTDKKTYVVGETANFFVSSSEKPTEVNAILDNGTRFEVDLPLTIPILNVKRIHQPYWWFILISVIANLGISTVMGKFKQTMKNPPVFK